MLKFTSKKTGEAVQVDATCKSDLLQKYLACADDGDWLWFFIAKQVRDSAGLERSKDMAAFLADLFVLAAGMGLKRPMIRLHAGGRRYKIYLSAKGTVCVKTGALYEGTSDPAGDEDYMGCVLPSGKFLASDRRRLLPADEDFMRQLGDDPVGFFARCSKDMGRCCYCNRALEDERSKAAGYGKDCAAHWGLPWGKGKRGEAVPSFADLWVRSTADVQRSVRGVCLAIRRDHAALAENRDRAHYFSGAGREAHAAEASRLEAELKLSWEVLADLLEEAGYGKRPKMPAGGVKLPPA